MNARAPSAQAGFTLLEALAGVAAMAAILVAIALMTGQWMPTWRHGFNDMQQADLLSLGLDRMAADLSAAEYVRLDAKSQGPLFEGTPTSAIFVRTAIGPNAGPGLEFVRIAETVDKRGFATVRESAPFAPGLTQPHFSGPVALTRAPFRVSFAYAGPDRHWIDVWTQNDNLPDSVRISLRDSRSGALLAASTAVRVKATAFAPSPEKGADGAPQPANAPASDSQAPDAQATGAKP